MIRGLVLVLLATPVCAGLATMMAVVGGHVVLTGEPFTWGELASALVFGLGGLGVVGLAIFMTTRSRDSSMGVKVYASLLVLGAITGGIGGAVFGLDIVADKDASMLSRVLGACETASHDRAIEGCEARARACIFEVREHPPEVARGFDASEIRSDDPNAPNTPDERAVYDCLRR